MKWTLNTLQQAGVIDHFDTFFAKYICPQGGSETLKVALALLRRANGLGNVAISLQQLALSELTVDETTHSFEPPTADEIKQELENSGLLASSEQTGPIVLEGDLLYLQKYYDYQSRFIENLTQRLSQPDSKVTSAQQAQLEQWFTTPKALGQKEACLLALKTNFMILTGGPGTGKTTTAFKILRLIQEGQLSNGLSPLRMRLLAPTGKATIRLTRTIEEQKQDLPNGSPIETVFEVQAETIHRFLGYDPVNPSSFLHHKTRQVDCELVLVDEASMIDLPLFCKLLEAIPTSARLILMGDPNQLASVESGAVLKDLVSVSAPQRSTDQPTSFLPLSKTKGSLAEHHRHLSESFRFGDQLALMEMCSAVLSGADHLHSFFDGKALCYSQATEPGGLKKALSPIIETFYAPLWSAKKVEQGIEILNNQAILCAFKQGPFGVQGVNQLAESIANQRTDGVKCWPLMITKNNPALGLFNGDVGLAWPEHGKTKVWFKFGKDLVSYPLGLLPEYVVAYGSTVHKSQGSEYHHIALILPPVFKEGLSRELVYTALTRSKEKFSFIGDLEVFEQSLSVRIQRQSGLSRTFGTSSA